MNKAWQAYEQVVNWATDNHMSTRARMRQTVRWGMHLILLLIVAAWTVFAKADTICRTPVKFIGQRNNQACFVCEYGKKSSHTVCTKNQEERIHLEELAALGWTVKPDSEQLIDDPRSMTVTVTRAIHVPVKSEPFTDYVPNGCGTLGKDKGEVPAIACLETTKCTNHGTLEGRTLVGPSLNKCSGGWRWGCKDKSDVLLTAEDDVRYCMSIKQITLKPLTQHDEFPHTVATTQAHIVDEEDRIEFDKVLLRTIKALAEFQQIAIEATILCTKNDWKDKLCMKIGAHEDNLNRIYNEKPPDAITAPQPLPNDLVNPCKEKSGTFIHDGGVQSGISSILCY